MSKHTVCAVLCTCGRGPSLSVVLAGCCPRLPEDTLPICLIFLPELPLFFATGLGRVPGRLVGG